MSSGRTPRPIHVERTAEPGVLRWEPHHGRLDTSPPGRRQIPERSPLGLLAAAASIGDITVQAGAVLISTPDPAAWPRLAPQVQDALLEELDVLDALEPTASHWLLEAAEIADHSPSITEIQRILDRSAGAVMRSHGGAMTVVTVDGGTVRLRSEGACTGCRYSYDTIVELISPALRAAYPEIVSVVVDHHR
jgi:Fe-S cluster biogenesis protein NfuA